MTSHVEFSESEVDDILAVVEVFIEELMDEFVTDNERVGAIAGNIVMSLAVLRQAKPDAEIINWLNGVVQSWTASSSSVH